MSSDEDFDFLLRYVRSELSQEETRVCEERLSHEPPLCKTLLAVAEEEAALRQWAGEHRLARQLIERDSQRDQNRSRYRSLVVTAVLVMVPPILLALTASLRSDAGLGIVAWAASMHGVIDQMAVVLGAVTICCWLGVRHHGWLRHPFAAAVCCAIAMLGTMWVGQHAVADRAATEQSRLSQLFQDETWVSYDSAYYWPEDLSEVIDHAPQEATPDEIRQELKTLREAGFTAIYLHECRTAQRDVSRLAREEGFRAVVMAIRVGDPRQLSGKEVREQIENAIAASQWVDAFCFGELQAREVDLGELRQHLAEIRRRTGKPVTTSFLDEDYFGPRGAPLRELADFTIRGLHHQWEPDPSVESAILRVKNAYQSFQQDDSPCLLTFVGFPSGGGKEWTEESQQRFFMTVHDSLQAPQGTNSVYYASFDLPWAQRLSEVRNMAPYAGHFGIFTTESPAGDRAVTFRPKACVNVFLPKK